MTFKWFYVDCHYGLLLKNVNVGESKNWHMDWFDSPVTVFFLEVGSGGQLSWYQIYFDLNNSMFPSRFDKQWPICSEAALWAFWSSRIKCGLLSDGEGESLCCMWQKGVLYQVSVKPLLCDCTLYALGISHSKLYLCIGNGVMLLVWVGTLEVVQILLLIPQSKAEEMCKLYAEMF